MKICTIGCGGHASTAHGPAQKKYADLHPETILAACCDQDASRAEAYRTQFGFERCYLDAADMLAQEKPDAVGVIVPTSVACQVAVPILRRGIPLFLEKPPGNTGADLEELIAAAAVGGAPHLVAFNRRHMPVFQQARRILDTEMPVESVFQIDYEMIRHDRRDADFSTTAIHAIDAALFLARSPYRQAALCYRSLEHLGAGIAEMEIEAECVSGTRVRFNIQPVGGRNTERVRILAHGKSLVLEFPVAGRNGPGAMLSFRNQDREVFAVHADESSVDLLGFYGETEDFFEGVRRARPQGLKLVECRQQVALMEAIRNRKPSVDFAG